MICPYICHAVQTDQVRREYDKEGRETFCENIQTERKEPMSCAGEACAVWRDGRCTYGWCGEC